MFRSCRRLRILSILPKIADISGGFAQFLPPLWLPPSRRFPGLYPYGRGRALDGSSTLAFRIALAQPTASSDGVLVGPRQEAASVVATDAIERRVSSRVAFCSRWQSTHQPIVRLAPGAESPEDARGRPPGSTRCRRQRRASARWARGRSGRRVRSPRGACGEIRRTQGT